MASYVIAKWPLKVEVSATSRASHPPRGDNCRLWLVASYCWLLLNMTCGPLLCDWFLEHIKKKKTRASKRKKSGRVGQVRTATQSANKDTKREQKKGPLHKDVSKRCQFRGFVVHWRAEWKCLHLFYLSYRQRSASWGSECVLCSCSVVHFSILDIVLV